MLIPQLQPVHKQGVPAVTPASCSRCCACGEPVSLLHIAGDMKRGSSVGWAHPSVIKKINGKIIRV